MKISHEKQQEIWEQEHHSPYALLQMDSQEPSGGVVKFFKWLQTHTKEQKVRGVEMACGKGRNVIWLAQQGVEMTGFDFSSTAIKDAEERAKKTGVKELRLFKHDATIPWPFADNSFDFAIDCFGSTDLESVEGRTFARNEFLRVLKPKGYLFVYTLSTDDEFHQKMIKLSPAEEKNAFYHPKTEKFEKTFDRAELLDFYKDFKLLVEERREKTSVFFEKEYYCKHFWMVFKSLINLIKNTCHILNKSYGRGWMPILTPWRQR